MRPIITLGLALLMAVYAGQLAAQVQRQRPPIQLTAAQEARYRALLPELRCLVCQDESLAASQAPLAADLRYEIRGLFARGDSNAQIKRYLTDRYGDYVLFKPPFKPLTWLLWLGPFIFALIALLVVWSYMRHRRSAPGVAGPEPDAAALRHLLDEER